MERRGSVTSKTIQCPPVLVCRSTSLRCVSPLGAGAHASLHSAEVYLSSRCRCSRVVPLRRGVFLLSVPVLTRPSAPPRSTSLLGAGARVSFHSSEACLSSGVDRRTHYYPVSGLTGTGARTGLGGVVHHYLVVSGAQTPLTLSPR